MSKKVNCLRCKYYYNTWDANLPRGCKVYGFKSMQMPSALVNQETKQGCMAFEEREHFKKKKGLDLNDPKNW